MTLARSKPLLRDIKDANPTWFGRGNKRFFGDVAYRAYYSKKTGTKYLVRSTYAWTDMLGGTRKLHFLINNLNQETNKILELRAEVYTDIFAVKAWLGDN